MPRALSRIARKVLREISPASACPGVVPFDVNRCQSLRLAILSPIDHDEFAVETLAAAIGERFAASRHRQRRQDGSFSCSVQIVFAGIDIE